MKGIQNVKNQIKKKRVSFDDYGKDAEHIEEAAEATIKTVESQKTKPAQSEVKSTERRYAKKQAITIHLLEEEIDTLEDINYFRRKNRIKTDRSTIVGDALRLLYDRESKRLKTQF